MNAYKNVRGDWEAEDQVNLPGGRQVRITTMKHSNGELITRATVGIVDGNVFTYAAYEDYRYALKIARPKRVTAKVVAAQHSECMSKIEELKEAIASYYKDKETVTE